MDKWIDNVLAVCIVFITAALAIGVTVFIVSMIVAAVFGLVRPLWQAIAN